MNIKEEREFIQELLEQGKLDSLSVQVISLVRFANWNSYAAVDNDPRKGFYNYYGIFKGQPVKHFYSFNFMVRQYNNCQHNIKCNKILERIGLHYNKKTGKLFTQKHWLKFVKEV